MQMASWILGSILGPTFEEEKESLLEGNNQDDGASGTYVKKGPGKFSLKRESWCLVFGGESGQAEAGHRVVQGGSLPSAGIELGDSEKCLQIGCSSSAGFYKRGN